MSRVDQDLSEVPLSELYAALERLGLTRDEIHRRAGLTPSGVAELERQLAEEVERQLAEEVER